MCVLRRVAQLFLLMMIAMWGIYASVAAQDDSGEIMVNVIGCVDATCANTVDIFTMDGATVTTYDGAGAMIDSCVVGSDASDMDGCMVAQHPSDGSIDIQPAAGYEDYALLSAEPTVFDGGERGTTFVWYFVPPAETAPASTEAPVTNESETVTSLPSTGSGTNTASAGPVASGALAALMLGAVVLRVNLMRSR